MAKLINGNGNPAIYAAEDADLIASLAGNVTCIANVGNKYAATEEDATTIRLDDGVIITKEGRRIQLEAGESDTFYIPTGTSGQTNYYIIGYKLVQNADSTQVAEQFVQKMNSSSETITEDTFRSGATEVYVSVYRVTQVGFTIDSISGLLPKLLDNASIKDNIDQINNDLSEETFGVSYTGIAGYERLGTVWFEWNNINLGTINTNSFQTIFTIPQDYRPLNEFYLPIVIMGHDAQLYVSTNGTVQLKVKDTGIAYSSVSLMFSYHIH